MHLLSKPKLSMVKCCHHGVGSGGGGGRGGDCLYMLGFAPTLMFLQSNSVADSKKVLWMFYKPRSPVCICVQKDHSMHIKDPVFNISLVDYGNSKVTKHALKKPEFKLVEVGHSTEVEPDVLLCSLSFLTTISNKK